MECNAENTRNIKMVIAYDGTNYHGFQRQKNALAIQEVLEDIMSPIFGHPVWIIGSGRTDTGVHARAQTINFITTSRIPVDKMPIAVNSRLPRDIAVLSAEEVSADFHARFSAEEKTYAYQLLISECPDPFAACYVWQVKKPLRLDLMREALTVIVGTHDFSSFEASGSTVRDPVRTIYEATLTEEGNDRITVRFRGNGFLYHMVRNLVGTLVDVGLGRTTVDGFREILQAHDRRMAGITAPPQGLFLENVRYPTKILQKDENTP